MKGGRFIHFSSLALRWLAIALLLAMPVGSGIAWSVGWAMHRPVQAVGHDAVGTTSLDYGVEYGEIIIEYSSGWVGTAPRQGEVFHMSGLAVSRAVLTLSGQTRGAAVLMIEISWWLLLGVNAIPILALRLVWPLLWRRPAPGCCPVCGYDLRATPDRCPECGTASATS